jgi:hypothetical protein
MEVGGQLYDSAALRPGIGGWIDPRAALDAVEYRKVSCLSRKSNPAVQQVTHWYTELFRLPIFTALYYYYYKSKTVPALN